MESETSCPSGLEEHLQEESTLKPSARGERTCFCHGEILVMLANYGWIMTFDSIDHPDIGKTGGRVYIHKRDVVGGTALTKGDEVSFYLYTDDQGLGAEACSLVGADDFESTHAAEVSPVWNTCAEEFVPAEVAPISSNFNAQAAEFVPSVFKSKIAAPHMNAINLAFFSDDESDDESSIGSTCDSSGIDGGKDNSDIESLCSDDCWQHAVSELQKTASSDDDSTSAGETRGSESGDATPWSTLTSRLAAKIATTVEMSSPTAVVLIPGFHLPPGLSLE